METIKNWAFSISTAAIVLTIIQMLVPKGNLEKILKITLSAFFLSILFSPLLIDADFEIEFNDSFEAKIDEYTKNFETEMYEMIESELSLQIERQIVVRLSEINVDVLEVSTVVKAESANFAKVQSVEIKLSDEYKIRDSEIRYQMKNVVDCQITVVYTSG